MIVGEGYPKHQDIGTAHFTPILAASNGKGGEDILNKLGHGKRVNRQLNPILWNSKVKQKTKVTICTSEVTLYNWRKTYIMVWPSPTHAKW